MSAAAAPSVSGASESGASASEPSARAGDDRLRLRNVSVLLPAVNLTRTHTHTRPWEPPSGEGKERPKLTEAKVAQGTLDYLLEELHSLKINEGIHLSMDDADGCCVTRLAEDTWELHYSCGGCMTTVALSSQHYEQWIQYATAHARAVISEAT